MRPLGAAHKVTLKTQVPPPRVFQLLLDIYSGRKRLEFDFA